VLGNCRSPLAPEIPTLAESGVPELAPLEAMAWTGLLAPAGTPQEAIAWWGRAFRALLAGPAFARRLAAQNVEAAAPGPPSDLGDRIARELARFGAVARKAGIDVAD
jgi:tripartite-type tricarboxylate transporter receptor subunit TctC